MNKFPLWIKPSKAVIAFFIILSLPFIIIYRPYKATNPENPLFIESWFRLSDYDFRPEQLQHALKVLLPVGKSKDYVDLMLSKRGGAEIIDSTKYRKGFYAYGFKPTMLFLTPDSWYIDVYYDKNDKIAVILFNRELINGSWNLIKDNGDET
jgi:hypothetical protein